MAPYSPQELRYLKSNELCRFGTASRDGMPHITPVIYGLDKTDPIIATDYGTKKLKNVRENPRVCLLVDDYRLNPPNRGLMIQGDCEILERGKEYLRLLKVLFDRFEFYRKNPWSEGESPILRVKPKKTVSWGLAAKRRR
jgi:uncharacterized protein